MAVSFMAVLNNGFKPKFVDIDLETLSMNSDEVIKILTLKLTVFITHAQEMD